MSKKYIKTRQVSQRVQVYWLKVIPFSFGRPSESRNSLCNVIIKNVTRSFRFYNVVNDIIFPFEQLSDSLTLSDPSFASFFSWHRKLGYISHPALPKAFNLKHHLNRPLPRLRAPFTIRYISSHLYCNPTARITHGNYILSRSLYLALYPSTLCDFPVDSRTRPLW